MPKVKARYTGEATFEVTLNIEGLEAKSAKEALMIMNLLADSLMLPDKFYVPGRRGPKRLIRPRTDLCYYLSEVYGAGDEPFTEVEKEDDR